MTDHRSLSPVPTSPGAAVLDGPFGATPAGGISLRREGAVGINTPAGGLPDPETWWRVQELAQAPDGMPAPAPVVTAPPLPQVWWDEAPVPPPVVVAAADPDLVDDPQSVTAVFMVPSGRADVPLARRPRGSRPQEGPGEERDGDDAPPTTMIRRRLSSDATSELVRPYVTGPIPLADWAQVDPRHSGVAPSGGAVVPDPCEATASRRRARQARQLLGTHLTPPSHGLTGSLPVTSRITAGAPGVDGDAVRPADAATAPGGLSLFEPAPAAPVAGGPWAVSACQGLPSRRDLRAKQRQANSGRSITRRRLATTGVLAVTAFGAVAVTAGPAALSALGVDLDDPSAVRQDVALAEAALPRAATTLASRGTGGQMAAVQAAAAEALADRTAKKARATRDRRDSKRLESAAREAASNLADLAAAQVRAEAARKEASRLAALRNVIRDPRSYAWMLLQERDWSRTQMTCLDKLWTRESRWDHKAANPSSGAYGIPQALPGSKMGSVAADWRTNPATQIKWGLNYIADRYGSPCAAWAHSERVGWY